MATTTQQKAIDAGMSEASAKRWVQYLGYKAARGEKPITLDQAVAQLFAVGKIV